MLQGEFHTAMMEQTIHQLDRELRGLAPDERSSNELTQINITLLSCSERREVMRAAFNITMESAIQQNQQLGETLRSIAPSA